ncbi:unnamed protein product [Penicillium egyptiacum]|uniref:Major facilitator superfamily (MFS) profile domain-containing protein n=1 Tax=Penicillium egyptiacum TaxID=1303716 RepID=A0A9W4PA59_9EURO|nr:unnamed protein product [Penicillium egyptiacum]
MPWGVLEVTTDFGHVPGTVLLEQPPGEEAASLEHLKKQVHGDETIILVPQPSDDPNDPLNWSLWTRDLLFLLLSYCCLLCVGGIGPILSSLALDIMALFDVSYTDVSLLTGYSLCATAASGIFISMVTHKYGKRMPLIFSMLCAFVGTIWGGFAQSYDSLLGARIIQGLSVSMFESVFFAIVGDLYFVHERGIRIAVVTTCVAGLSNLPTVLAGKIATDLGWRWVFWILAIFIGVGLVLSILFGRETAYKRQAAYNTDLTSSHNLDYVDGKRDVCAAHIERSSATSPSVTETTTVSNSIPRQTFAARLRLYSTCYSEESLGKLAIKPIVILQNPAVIWAALLLAFPTLWVVAINLLIAEIFASPPFLLTTAELGYMSSGPALGGFVGSIAAAIISDPLIKFMARRNKGIYEPEYRLVLMIPAMVLSAISYFLFGALIEHRQTPIAMAALWGTATAALQFITMAVGTYCVDAYRKISMEIFIATMVIKNFLFYGFSCEIYVLGQGNVLRS